MQDCLQETKKDIQQSFHSWRTEDHRRHQCLWHGNRQAGRAVGRSMLIFPGSLENYLQEAGPRLTGSRGMASCVLLFTQDDVERQFGMSARSRLTRREIHGVLRALRNLDRKKRLDGEVVATPAEILGEDDDKEFARDSATDDTRVRTAVAWLEEAVLLTREENRVQVFPSSLRVTSTEEARARLEKADITRKYRRQLLAIAGALIEGECGRRHLHRRAYGHVGSDLGGSPWCAL